MRNAEIIIIIIPIKDHKEGRKKSKMETLKSSKRTNTKIKM
jgi:hypothetical protein